MDSDGAFCNCPDYTNRLESCKHIWGLEFTLIREKSKPPTAPQIYAPPTPPVGPVSIAIDPPAAPESQTYWQSYNKSQRNEKPLFRELLRDLCAGIPQPPPAETGRPQVPIADLVFGLVDRTYSRLSTRRFESDITACADSGYISAPHSYNTAYAFLKDPDTTTLLRQLIIESSMPMQGIETVFAPDSSGFATNTYSRWFDEKYGKKRSTAIWLKAHIITGVKSRIITAANASPNQTGDITEFPSLLDDTRRHFSVEEIVADSAYLDQENMERMESLGIDAYIPFKFNSKFHKKERNSVWNRALAFYILHEDDFYAHYHTRSNVETAFSMVKQKFGASVESRLPDSQVNALLGKFIAHNICVLVRSIYDSGLAPTFWKAAA